MQFVSLSPEIFRKACISTAFIYHSYGLLYVLQHGIMYHIYDIYIRQYAHLVKSSFCTTLSNAFSRSIKPQKYCRGRKLDLYILLLTEISPVSFTTFHRTSLDSPFDYISVKFSCQAEETNSFLVCTVHT